MFSLHAKTNNNRFNMFNNIRVSCCLSICKILEEYLYEFTRKCIGDISWECRHLAKYECSFLS